MSEKTYENGQRDATIGDVRNDIKALADKFDKFIGPEGACDKRRGRIHDRINKLMWAMVGINGLLGTIIALDKLNIF